jgi:photosystem II stability/assembly factor-like uncharacterized protein
VRKQIYLIILIAICELLSQFTGFAQWKKIKNLPQPFDDGPNNGGYYLEVMFLPSNPKLGWVCGFNGYVLRTVDGGNTWHGTVVRANYQLESIIFLDSLNGYTSGILDDYYSSDGRIFKSTDGGVSWRDVTPRQTTTLLWGNYFVTPDIGVVNGGGCGDDQQFFHTTDGGTNWSLFTASEPNSGLTDSYLTSATGLGYAVSSGRLWRTFDGGLTWNLYSVTGNEDWQEEISISGNTFLLPFATTCSGNGGDGGLRISVDGGINWREFRTGQTMFGAFMLDSKRGWGCGSAKSIYYTSDAGKTWVLRNCGIENNDSLDDMWFINDTTGWVVGRGIYKYFQLDTLNPSITATATTKCEGDSVVLTADKNYNYYNWSTGETSKSITVKKSGSYWIKVSNTQCDTSKSNEIQINFNPAPHPLIVASDTLICTGDSVTLSLDKPYPIIQWSTGETSQTINVKTDNTYSVSVTDTNGCTGTGSLHITVIPNPKPDITKFSHQVSCFGDTIFLQATPGYTNYQWYDASKNQLINSGSNKITVVSNGDYYVIVSNQYGCSGSSDTMNISFVIDSNRISIDILSSVPPYLYFDSTNLLTMFCKRLRIRNVGPEPEIISSLLLARNIEFSLPQSQFPITILPSDSFDLEICYQPSALGEQRDTLYIPDHCTPHEVPLLGIGSPNIYSGNSNCSVPIRLQSTGLAGYYFDVSTPIPNPAQTTVSLPFSRFVPARETQVESCKLYNSLGSQVSTGFEKISQSGSNAQGTFEQGEFFLDLKSLPDGLYYAIINSKNNKFIYPVVVSK